MTASSDEARPEPSAELDARVAAHPFLAGISQYHFRVLADCAMPRTFETDEFVFHAGDTANRFYLIEEGSVALEATLINRPPVAIDLVEKGGLLGWSWLFPPYIWHFDARALEPTSAIFFYGTFLREYCEKDPTLGLELFKRMSTVMVDRLQAARAKLIAALTPD